MAADRGLWAIFRNANESFPAAAWLFGIPGPALQASIAAIKNENRRLKWEFIG
jgi:hypothetical protein